MRTTRRTTAAWTTLGFLLSLVCAQPATARFDYAGQWGTLGTGSGQFLNAAGIASDSAGNVYVADSAAGASRVQRFTADGAPQLGWGALGQFSTASQIAVDPFGAVYVSDSGAATIQKFDSNGVASLPGPIGTRGSNDGQFQLPTGTATDAEGNLYVTDEQLGRVQKFTPDGVHLITWTGAQTRTGRFVAARDVAVDVFGDVYVLDAGAGVVDKFTADGEFLSDLGSPGPSDGQFSSPGGISADGTGRIFVADTGNNRVQVFNADGAYVEGFGSPGSGDGQFSGPSDVAADVAGFVYVTDAGNARVQKFVEPSPPLPPPQAFVTANVERVDGTVLVRRPGQRAFLPLKRIEQVPIGATIQARRGRVRLVTARDKPRKGRRVVLQSAIFNAGSFTLRQEPAANPVVDLKLAGGDFSGCAPVTGAVRARSSKKKRRSHSVRRLWGDGRGRYRTTGSFSASSVKGTRWLTDDRCDGTLTRVVRGTVEVRDFGLRRTVRVSAGKTYLARAR